jgi:hypothetical protein
MKIVSNGYRAIKVHPKKIRNYLELLEEKCLKNNVNLIISGGENIVLSNNKTKQFCGGYFTEGPEPEMKIAFGRSSKFTVEIMIHEESHMDQWLDKDSIWHRRDIAKKIDNFWGKNWVQAT